MRRFSLDDVLRTESFGDRFSAPVAFSASGRRVAFALTGPMTSAPRFGVTFLIGRERSRLHVVDLPDGEPRALDSGRWGLSSPVWSPDGTRIAAVATDGERLRACVVDCTSGAMTFPTERSLAGSWALSQLHWLSPDELMCRVLAEDAVSSSVDVQTEAARMAMRRWPLVWSGTEPTSTVLRSRDPDHRESDGSVVVCHLADGSVHEPADLDAAPEAVRRFASEQPPTEGAMGWATDGVILAEHPASARRVVLEDDETGTRLHLVGAQGTGPRRVLVEANTWRSAVEPGPIVDLPVESKRGRKLVVQCVLPPDFEPGKLVTTVMQVYMPTPGSIRLLRHHRITSAHYRNPQILAAQGHVVAIPQMPFFEDEARTDVIGAMLDCLEPAIERMVEAGLADRRDIHLIGQSMGGWAVACLLARTKWFRSGIATAGVYNLLSFIGQFDVRHTHLSRYAAILSGMARHWNIDAPPEVDITPYLLNSPALMANDIDAPLLLMHGDRDYVPIQQSEEMFSALRRSGKEAEFVRYWGEDHEPSSPANMRDFWRRVSRWLGEHGLSRRKH